MKTVESAAYFPGACIVSGEATNLIDLERINAHDEQVYLAVQLILDCARHLGMWGPEEIAAAREAAEERDRLQTELDELTERHVALVNSVRITLSEGGTVDKRTLRPKLRAAKGAREVLEEVSG